MSVILRSIELSKYTDTYWEKYFLLRIRPAAWLNLLLSPFFARKAVALLFTELPKIQPEMQTPVNLLWTSGWDSSFRLLHLLLVQKRPVQPYYIIDRGRRSLDVELRTMEKIRKAVFSKAPDTQSLLLPIIFKELEEIKPNVLITRQYRRLVGLGRLGSQYEYIARYADEVGLTDLEMSIEKDLEVPIEKRTFCFFASHVRPDVIGKRTGDFYNYRLRPQPANPDVSLFKYFKFPTIELTKLDMKALAIKYGFMDVMEHTWFCHSPKNGMPCGVCHPCSITIREGQGDRIPLVGRLRYLVQYKVRPTIKRVLRSSPKKVLRGV